MGNAQPDLGANLHSDDVQSANDNPPQGQDGDEQSIDQSKDEGASNQKVVQQGCLISSLLLMADSEVFL